MAHSRRIFVINPKFQYKFCFIICSLVFLGSLVYPLTIYELFEYIFDLAGKLQSSGVVSDGSIDQYRAQRASLTMYLILTQLGFIGLVFIFCIFISHKIAGPMYKLTMFLQNIRNGGEINELFFRETDQFSEIADEINLTLTYLTEKSEDERETIEEIKAYIENISLVVPEDKKPVLEEIQRKLNELK